MVITFYKWQTGARQLYTQTICSCVLVATTYNLTSVQAVHLGLVCDDAT